MISARMGGAPCIRNLRIPVATVVELGLAAETPLEKVREALKGLTLSEILFSGPAQVRGVSALDGGKIVVQVEAPAQPGQALAAELALREAAAEALRTAGVEIK